MVGPRATGQSSSQVQKILKIREKARGDLGFFAKHVLGYEDIEDETTHEPFIAANMMKWKGAPMGQDFYTGKPPYYFSYKPPSDDLGGCIRPGNDWPRKKLLLVFRSSFKTTINVVSDAVHTHIRFPRLAMQVFHATEEKAEDIAGEIAEHYVSGEAFRYYFPDFVPHTPGDKRKHKSKGGFYSVSRLSSPSLKPQRKEATFAANALGKISSSAHVDVIKFTDIVDMLNSETEDQCRKVWRRFMMSRNLLSDPYKLIDVEGTIYSPFDTYNKLLDLYWHKMPENERQKTWHFTYIPALRVKNQTFTPDDIGKPWLTASVDQVLPSGKRLLKGQEIPYWPVWRGDQPRVDNDALAEYKRDDPEGYAGQMLLLPYTEASDTPFPVKEMRFIPEKEAEAQKIIHTRICIDTAETVNKYSNSSALWVGQYTSTGRLIIRFGRIEKLTSEELLSEIFRLNREWKPEDILIEETGYVRGLKLSIELESRRLGEYPPIEYLNREPASGKHDRIQGRLEIPYKSGKILFAENAISDLSLSQLKMEMSGFRRVNADDGLDGMADFFHPSFVVEPEGREEKEEVVKEMSRREKERIREAAFEQLVFGTLGESERLMGESGEDYGL